ncbi:MAG TPA: phosphoserine transaminase [Acidimicrobiales bacterium]|nr:phosphoserine transaminase [Acidimicrobiales bacterium]
MTPPPAADSLPEITIPEGLKPSDGRFGCGPSKVRPEAIEALVADAPTYMGTSHRQPTVKFMVARLRNAVAELFAAPDGYEVLLGNGGTTGFWDAATFGLIENKSQHLDFGEFSSKFAKAAKAAPFLDEPQVIESATGTHPVAVAADDVDFYALTHNETSTGVMMPIVRPAGATGLVGVDATSGAGGLRVDLAETDVYYFAPQKCLAADGGLWIAVCSPAAIERIEQIEASGRWIPASIDLSTALENSRKDQTYNTPALATIHLAVSQLEWLNNNGGLEFAASRCDRSAEIMYGWAEKTDYTTPFVTNPDERSHVVATIDFDDAINASMVSKVLRANGIVDTEAYRKLGRNQVRIGMFPAIEPDDVAALTDCIEHVVTALG